MHKFKAEITYFYQFIGWDTKITYFDINSNIYRKFMIRQNPYQIKKRNQKMMNPKNLTVKYVEKLLVKLNMFEDMWKMFMKTQKHIKTFKRALKTLKAINENTFYFSSSHTLKRHIKIVHEGLRLQML